MWVWNPVRQKQKRRPVNKLLAEALGTFGIVFAGTGAIVVDQLTHQAIGHAGIALTFGLIVAAMIYAFGDISGAHLNPAVTMAFALAGRFEWQYVVRFILAQLAGALAGSLLLRFLFPSALTLGGTLPLGPAYQSFVLELVLTFLLMLVILRVSTGAREKGITAGLAIGAVVALEAMFAGPICGASMNPARSLAPAAVCGQWASLWIYLIAPTLGAALAAPVSAALHSGPTPHKL